MGDYLAPLSPPLGGAPAPKPGLRPQRTVIVLLALLAAVAVGYLYWVGRPRRLIFMESSAGMSATIEFRTEVSDVMIEWPDGRKNSAFLSPYARGTNGEVPPTSSVTLMLNNSDLTHATTRFRARYRVYGIPRSADIEFDPRVEKINAARAIIDGIPNAWIQTSHSSSGKVWFSSLLSYKHVLKEIRWGFDDEPLDRRVKFSPSESLNEGIAVDDELYATVPPDVTRVRMQLVYKDGVTSSIHTIRIEDAAH